MNTMTSAFRVKPRKIKGVTRKPAAAAKTLLAIKATPQTLTGLSRVFKQLGDESRLKILLALCEYPELHVSALCDLLNQTQPAVSHHLTLLRMSGLVGFRRQGKNNFYRIESGLMCTLLHQLLHEYGSSQNTISFEGFTFASRRK